MTPQDSAMYWYILSSKQPRSLAYSRLVREIVLFLLVEWPPLQGCTIHPCNPLHCCFHIPECMNRRIGLKESDSSYKTIILYLVSSYQIIWGKPVLWPIGWDACSVTERSGVQFSQYTNGVGTILLNLSDILMYYNWSSVCY